jgi:VacB/RNase II family 3'-5' exoribonuclease
MKEPSAENRLRAIAQKAMIARGLAPDFPQDAMRQLSGIQGPARDTDHSVRDLRSGLWCSIDNDSSRDLDQLTLAENHPSGHKVLIAIADVDALVKPASPIDGHAMANTTSVYTAARIFPMLPEKLSTDLTSLNEGQDRLALIVEMVVNADGVIQDSDVYRAVVNNKAKLAYPSVAAWLEHGDKMPDKVARVPGLDGQLKVQDQIAQVLRSARYQHGALDLRTIEPEAVFRDGEVIDLREEKKNRAQELIEDFMIAANGVTAQFLQKRGLPALRRIVRSPKQWDRIRTVAKEFHEELPASPDPKALAAFLARRQQADPLRFPDLSLTIIKLLGPGEYVLQLPGHDATGHFGLAVRDYGHSTAPNRRFPDLITLRLLKAALAASTPPYNATELASLATHCTQQEDAARKVERWLRKSAAAQFLSGQIGHTFDALVTGASEKGTWVRLLSPPAEGRLVAGTGGVDVGDRIKVELKSVDIDRGFVDFVRSSNNRKLGH